VWGLHSPQFNGNWKFISWGWNIQAVKLIAHLPVVWTLKNKWNCNCIRPTYALTAIIGTVLGCQVIARFMARVKLSTLLAGILSPHDWGRTVHHICLCLSEQWPDGQLALSGATRTLHQQMKNNDILIYACCSKDSVFCGYAVSVGWSLLTFWRNMSPSWSIRDLLGALHPRRWRCYIPAKHQEALTQQHSVMSQNI